MYLTPLQTFFTILTIAFGTMLTRFLPFLIFPEHKPTPKFISYLGSYLPAAVTGLLVVYCFKGVSLTSTPYGLPELIAIVTIVILHKWKHQVLLSIGMSTLVYMFLIQYVFK